MAERRRPDEDAPGLLILKDQAAEDAESPEFRYLLSWTINQARKVFGPVAVRVRRPDAPLAATLPRARAVLLLGGANVLCTSRSFERLRHALSGGAPAAVPRALGGVPLPEHPPLYTLGDYERLEAEVLQRGEPDPDATATQLPISLLSWAAFERALTLAPIDDLLTRPRPLADLGPGVATAGLFHQFVDYYGEVREDVLPWLPPGARHVLEIGCGRGLTGQLMQERLGCRVTGIELNPHVARDAERRLWRVLRGDVQTLAIPDRYDAIVATELFEHLEDPAALLRKLAPCLAPGGRVILSVPNVGHYAVVEDLLAGRWDYLPIGLLCYTHVRFFTRTTLEDWIERAWDGSWQVVPQPTEPPPWIDDLPAGLSGDRENLGAKGFWAILHAP